MMPIFTFGIFKLDSENHELWANGMTLNIERKTLNVLELFLREAGKAISNDSILKNALESEFGTDEAVTKQISKLRKLFNQYDSNQGYIKTLHGHKSYKFAVSVKITTSLQPNYKGGVVENVRELEPQYRLNADKMIEMLSPIVRSHQENGKVLCVIWADLDRFTQLNNKFNDSVGNKVLRFTKLILRKHVRGNQVYQIQGDQFIVILSGITAEQAFNIAKICQSKILKYDWSTIVPGLYVTCAFGIAELKRFELANNFILRAIHAVKLAKKGVNVVQFAPEHLPSYFSMNIFDHLS